MQERTQRLAWLRCAVIMVAFVLALARSSPGQGQYRAVTADDVVQLTLNHYFTPDNKGHDLDFAWTFTKEEFVVKAGKGPIPADLMKRLLPAGAKAVEIRGKWKIIAEEGQIAFTDILATDASGGDVLGNKAAKYRIYRTAPTVVRIGEPQYVFGMGR